MNRTLSFDLGGLQFQVQVTKVDRKKVYGWVNHKAVNATGQPCYLGSLSRDGMNIFSPGCFEMGHLDADGNWVERREMDAVDESGALLQKHPSSFQQTISLNQTVDMDTYLQVTVKAVYQLQASAEMSAHVGAADGFYHFPYNYTASYTPDEGFLVPSGDALFLVVGEDNGYTFVGPTQVAAPPEMGEDEDGDDADDIDFGMF